MPRSRFRQQPLQPHPQLRPRLVILLTMVMGGYKLVLSMNPPFVEKEADPPVSKTGWRKPEAMIESASLVDANMVEQEGTTAHYTLPSTHCILHTAYYTLLTPHD